jgi:hypothetical protein
MACFISFWKGEASAIASGVSIWSQSRRASSAKSTPWSTVALNSARSLQENMAPFQFAVHIVDALVDHDLQSDYAAAASNP